MLVQIWKAALFAAAASLLGNPLWAQETVPVGGFATGYAPLTCVVKDKCAKDKDCCEKADCCKDGKCCEKADCCKDGKCCDKADCCKGGKCCEKADCCKGGKCCKSGECDCASGGKCCCKKGECKCKKATACEAANAHGFIVVMPAMPAMESLPAMPHPMPLLSPPGLPVPPPPPGYIPGVAQPVAIPMPGYYAHPPQYMPQPAMPMPEICPPQFASAPMPAPAVEAMPCAMATPAVGVCAKPVSEAKVHFIAAASGEALKVDLGEETHLQCQKTKVTIGGNELRLTHFEDRIRVRGENLRATADRVRGESKDRLILEGDVVLFYKKDGHKTHASGECVEVNLTTGAITIQPSSVVPK
jgi:hypothetical protein